MRFGNAIKIISVLRKYIKNWLYVSIYIKLNNYPVIIEARNGNVYLARNYDEFRSIFVKIKYGIEFKFIEKGGDLGETFYFESYKFSILENRTVVDVGANIGDSSIYFAIQGASRVIAIEPLPQFFNALTDNIKENKLENIIVPLNLMVGNENKKTNIDTNIDSGLGTKAEETLDGFEVNKVTLSYIADKFKIVNGKLKMDCEGCEYYSIIPEKDEILRKFDEMIIEYHNGFQGLKNKLEQAGFKVSIEKRIIYAFRT